MEQCSDVRECSRHICNAATRNESSCVVLQEGVIDALASDHSPSPCDDKKFAEGNFLQAWGGVSGSESSPAHFNHTFIAYSLLATDRFRFGYNMPSESIFLHHLRHVSLRSINGQSIADTCPGLVLLHARLSPTPAGCLCEYPDHTQAYIAASFPASACVCFLITSYRSSQVLRRFRHKCGTVSEA